MIEPATRAKGATIPQPVESRYRSADLEACFAEIFQADHRTVLCGGAQEPWYQVARGADQFHRIHYRADYFRSALHEVAHWCVAGPRRRQLDDFGYWYAPDGRNAEQQQEFMRVEVHPQALEALFCAACGHRFQVSLDNLDGDPGDAQVFATKVRLKAESLLAQGLAERPRRWCQALMQRYRADHLPLQQALQQVYC